METTRHARHRDGSAFDGETPTTTPKTGLELTSRPRSIVLPVGSKVTVRWLSGKILLATEYAPAWKRTDWETFLLAILIAAAKRLNLPPRYGQIIWKFERGASELTEAEGWINFTGPREEDDSSTEDPYMDQQLEFEHCGLCDGDCQDVDCTVEGCRSKNCARCFPCNLCDECKICLPKQAFDDWSRMTVAQYEQHHRADAPTRHTWPVCFRCLGKSDSDVAFMKDIYLSQRQDYRLSVLNYDFHARLHLLQYGQQAGSSV